MSDSGRHAVIVITVVPVMVCLQGSKNRNRVPGALFAYKGHVRIEILMPVFECSMRGSVAAWMCCLRVTVCLLCS